MMDAPGQADNAKNTVSAVISRASAVDAAANEPSAQAQFLLGAVLLVVGMVAFLPMMLPTLTGHQHDGGGPTRQALAQSSLSQDMLYMQAHEKVRRGQYEPAIEELTKVINASSRRIDAYYNRGRCYMSMRQPRFDLALSDFNRAIALDPHDGDLYRLRATAYEHLGNQAMALADRKMADKYTWHDPK
jgi:tetratricopeptide (TPR) repeat protein